MTELHAWNGLLVIAALLLSAGWGGTYVLRRRTPGRVYAHVLAGAQALVIAQVALGLLLLSDDRRATDELHYAYGSLSLAAILAPWLYAPAEGPRRLAWFAGASALAAALAVRAFMTGS